MPARSIILSANKCGCTYINNPRCRYIDIPLSSVNTSFRLTRKYLPQLRSISYLCDKTRDAVSIILDETDEQGKQKNISKADRFAAEFLVDEDLLLAR